jgi:hypothetical protein
MRLKCNKPNLVKKKANKRTSGHCSTRYNKKTPTLKQKNPTVKRQTFESQSEISG